MSAARLAQDPRPVALVTGAGRRIGRSIALALAARGFDVAIQYQSSHADAAAVADEAQASGARTVLLAADLSNPADVEGLVSAAAAALRPVTLLVNNASEFRDDTLLSMDARSWTAHLDVNLRAPVFLARALALQLPEGAHGHVVNIIDQRVLRLTPEFFSYTVSKAGLWAATQTMAQALAPRVRVNAIGPGPVLPSVHQSDADFAAECAGTLLKRGASPAEIAAAVLFLHDTPSMTGQLLALDGGQHLA